MVLHPSLEILFWVYAAFLGAVVGSFLNVVIARMPYGQSVVKPRSRCPHCETPIAWYDNVPMLAWMWLGARCRHCKASISARYPMIELMMMCLSLALVMRWGFSFDLLWLWPSSAVFLAIAFMDLDHFWISNKLVFGVATLALLAIPLPGGIPALDSLLGLAPAAALWGFALLFKAIRKKEGMGMGDIKLLAVMGLLLSWRGAFAILTLASIQGAVVGIAVKLLPKSEKPPKPSIFEDGWTPQHGEIPFGPFLVLAFFEVVLWPHLFGAFPFNLAELLLRP